MLFVFKASSVHPRNVHFSGVSPEKLCSDFSRQIKSAFIELTSVKRFDSEVSSFYIRAMLPFAHTPFLQMRW